MFISGELQKHSTPRNCCCATAVPMEPGEVPNPQAKARDYIEGFGLTPAEFELIRQLGEASRQFVIKQGGNVTVASLDLSGCEDELLVFSGSPDMAEAAEHAVAQAGANPANWLPVYLNTVKQSRQAIHTF